MNGKKTCYCVPISECEKVDSLDALDPKEDEAIIKKIKEQQNKWWKSEVKNRNYTYKNKPEWML